MNHIVIVGSGPVGSFMAVLCRYMGFEVTVYEKRGTFTRNINLKIDSYLFKETQDVLSGLNIKSDFFTNFYNCLQKQNNRILIAELEQKFSEEAKSLGAKYIIKEVACFRELFEEYKTSNPIILDCTGRNSILRREVLGRDEDNVVSTPLQYAMYINFKGIISDVTSLYQAMKNAPNIKLTEVVVSKNKDKNGFTNVTLPVFITGKLNHHFDEEYQDINRKPLNPFNSSVSVPDPIFLPISSVLGNLIVDDCYVDLSSVKVKKIVISCGYAKTRSKDNFICLGDSAVHLAFFRSLNLGLKHALELFIYLSMFSKDNDETKDSSDVMLQFKKNNPHLNPIRALPTKAKNVYLVITKVLLYGCFTFCTTNNKTTRLTAFTGKTEKKIDLLIAEYSEKISKWEQSLIVFEETRDYDIKSEISSNKFKNASYQLISGIIDINGFSILKISELIRATKGLQPLFKNDFHFLLSCFKVRREVLESNSGSKDEAIISIIYSLSKQLEENDFPMLEVIKGICMEEKLSSAQKLMLITDIVNIFTDKKSTMEARIATQIIKHWPKLVGLRFDASNVQLNIVLTIMRNELQIHHKLLDSV